MTRRKTTVGNHHAGTISKIKLVNFMCHSNLCIQLDDHVNFITGQNGSGKSAVLIALCVAFGATARGTQRGVCLKDFIKTGCSHGIVVVELKNEGSDAYMPMVYGARINIERKITPTSSTVVIKNEQGLKVSSKKQELKDIVDYFNIDVENPCIIMSQEKSRTFLNSGNPSDKFKATLLEKVSDLLDSIDNNILDCQFYLKANERTFKPLEEELSSVNDQLQRAKSVDSMALEVTNLRKKLAWSYVHAVDKDIDQVTTSVSKINESLQRLLQEISKHEDTVARSKEAHSETTALVNELRARNVEAREREEDLEADVDKAAEEKAHLQGQAEAILRLVQEKRRMKTCLEQQVSSMHQSFVQASQAEHLEQQSKLRLLEEETNSYTHQLERFHAEELNLNEQISQTSWRALHLRNQIELAQLKRIEMQKELYQLRQTTRNKLCAFGGDIVLKLLKKIEESRYMFSSPPLGPIGAHIALQASTTWSLAIEIAVGRLLNAFVVSNHRDMLALRKLGRECQYNNLQIIIYDFQRPLLTIPDCMLPSSSLRTVMSVLHAENPTIKNVLIDLGNVERQVLVEDVEEGMSVAFGNRFQNIKEAITRDGTKMFSKRGCQVTLPSDRYVRVGRLGAQCSQILQVEGQFSSLDQELASLESDKRTVEATIKQLQSQLNDIQQKGKEIRLQLSKAKSGHCKLKREEAEAAASACMPNTEEIDYEILDAEATAQKLERSLGAINARLEEVLTTYHDAKLAYDNFRGWRVEENETLERSRATLGRLEAETEEALAAIGRYAREAGTLRLNLGSLNEKLKTLQEKRETYFAKASRICSEEEALALGAVVEGPQRLSKELERLQNRRRCASGSVAPANQLMKEKVKLQNRINKRKRRHSELEKKVETILRIQKARRRKFEDSCSKVNLELKWRFIDHLSTGSFSGDVSVDYKAQTLHLQVRTAEGLMVKDLSTRSGGERAFITVCFGLALHEKTESPFRGMDEFDVFMDTIIRRQSLETLTNFALMEGSQWLFITPYDLSFIKSHPSLKTLQLVME